MIISNLEYIGRNFAYPIKLENGKRKVDSGIQVIENAYISILTTPYGTRFMNPEYGTRAYRLLYEQNDEVLARLMRVYLMEDLNNWEGRAKVRDVTVLQYNDVMLCKIDYEILAITEINSFVFPFYKSLLS